MEQIILRVWLNDKGKFERLGEYALSSAQLDRDIEELRKFAVNYVIDIQPEPIKNFLTSSKFSYKVTVIIR